MVQKTELNNNKNEWKTEDKTKNKIRISGPKNDGDIVSETIEINSSGRLNMIYYSICP